MPWYETASWVMVPVVHLALIVALFVRVRWFRYRPIRFGLVVVPLSFAWGRVGSHLPHLHDQFQITGGLIAMFLVPLLLHAWTRSGARRKWRDQGRGGAGWHRG